MAPSVCRRRPGCDGRVLGPRHHWRAAEGAIDDVGEMHGAVAVRRYIQDWIDIFDDLSVVVEELRDVGDDRVLAIQRVKGRAKLSGIETDMRLRRRQTVRDGKVVRGREYLSVEDGPRSRGAAGVGDDLLDAAAQLRARHRHSLDRTGPGAIKDRRGPRTVALHGKRKRSPRPHGCRSRAKREHPREISYVASGRTGARPS